MHSNQTREKSSNMNEASLHRESNVLDLKYTVTESYK
jgi:hypothetical protein